MSENWKQHLKDYHEFMQWDSDDEYDLDIDAMSQEEAKSRLKEDMEFILGSNGWGDIFETERYYMRKLDMEEGFDGLIDDTFLDRALEGEQSVSS